MKKYYILLIALFIAVAIGLTQITIFVVQPIGAVPDGKTLVIWKKITVVLSFYLFFLY